MLKTNRTLLKDMELIRAYSKRFFADGLPVEYSIGDRKYKGIPEVFNPVIKRKIIDASLTEIVMTGTDPVTGIQVKAECLEYKDYPVIEWTLYFTNTSDKDSPIIQDLYACKATLNGKQVRLHHGNGDFYSETGLKTDIDNLNEGDPYTFKPDGGRPCDGAFPYYRAICEGFGYNLSIGWPGQWKADFIGGKEGFSFHAKQEYTHFYLKPGEVVRTPRMTLMCFTGNAERGANMWRRWYISHILPKTRGENLPPELVTHVMGGGEEFTLADEHNQLEGIKTYLNRGLKFDIWWIDAGWYPCKDESGIKRWVRTGNWVPDPEKFPNGLAPVGKLCDAHDIQLLVWFEPERVILDYWPKDMSGEYLLKYKYEDEKGNEITEGTALLNLGNPEARKWITGHINKLIKENHIKIYRQDFNMAPLAWWLQNETEDRRGITENLHIQGYLQFWDDLLIENPDLWIDACASGGRRNDLETMRRAVPLQYTDYGLGEHVIKESFNYTMFSWLPYFRNHTWSWDDIYGDYYTDKPKMPPVDNYGYQAAMAPSLTCMVSPYEESGLFEYCIKMNDIWRKAAGYMLHGDYYPLLPYSKSKDSFYSVQFHIEDKDEGVIQGIRNLKCPDESRTVFPKCFCDDKLYKFESPEFNKSLLISGKDINEKGFTFNLPLRTGEVWFYSVKK